MNYFLKYLPAALRFTLVVVSCLGIGYNLGLVDGMSEARERRVFEDMKTRKLGYWAALKYLEGKFAARAAQAQPASPLAIGSTSIANIMITGNSFTPSAPAGIAFYQMNKKSEPDEVAESHSIQLARLDGRFLLGVKKYREDPSSPWRYRSEIAVRDDLTLSDSGVESKALWDLANLVLDASISSQSRNPNPRTR